MFTRACKGSHITRHTSDRAGSFSGVTGGRAQARETWPPRAAVERRKRSQPCPDRFGPMQTLLNDTKRVVSVKSVNMGVQRIAHHPPHPGQGGELFRSDWREGAVFSRLICGGSPGTKRMRGERRRGQVYPPTAAPEATRVSLADKSQKRPARETWPPLTALERKKRPQSFPYVAAPCRRF